MALGMVHEGSLKALVEWAFAFGDESHEDPRIVMSGLDFCQEAMKDFIVGGNYNRLMPEIIHEGFPANRHYAMRIEDNGKWPVMGQLRYGKHRDQRSHLRVTRAHGGNGGNDENQKCYDSINHAHILA
jgi:hypothetical protein